MDRKKFFGIDTQLILQLFIGLTMLFNISISSDCDVEFVYSDYFNSNGFKVTCQDITGGQENIIRYISAHNALLLVIKNATLVNITSELFENVPKIVELTIDNSTIIIDGHIDLFSKLEQLQKLSLRNSKLQQVGTGTFRGLRRLTYLSLENNSITSIPRNSFKLPDLEVLEFTNNELKDIENLPLCELLNIKFLNFSKNKIRKLAPDLYRCQTEKKKSYSRNSFIEDNHFGIEKIDLSRNQIETLQGTFRSLKNLQQLNLNHNALTQLSEKDFDLTLKLEHLNLANNTISSIAPTTFSKLRRLEKIDLSRNQIENVQLQSLNNLYEVNLAHNRLRFENVQGIRELPQLEILDLSYNELNGTTYFFNSFPSLKSLNLNGNNLILHSFMFSNSTKLEKLYLSNNGILHIPNEIFRNISTLLELDLSNNKLTRFDNVDVFSSLVNLQMLNLAYNNLSDLNYKLFVFLDDVVDLNIAGNKLKNLDYSLIVTSMRSLETIHLHDNQFSCKSVHAMIKYLAWKGVNYKTDNLTYYDDENVGGIHCLEETVNIPKEKQKIPEKTVSIGVIVLVSIIALVLIVLFLMLFKYYWIYKRNKYNSEQFELIQD